MTTPLFKPGRIVATPVAAFFKRVRSDPVLKRICDLAGRYRRVAQSKQRRKTVHGLDDVVGVEPGGDLARLLPHELAKLAVPELELDTLRRLVERQTLCREHHATEPVGKGPIIITVDESGSMNGEKVHMAKALALALAWIARQQGRWSALVAYSGDSGERMLARPARRSRGDPPPRRRGRLATRSTDLNAPLDSKGEESARRRVGRSQATQSRPRRLVVTNLVSDKVRDLADSLSPFPVHQPLESSMTAQATLVNGRPQRKQLSEQLDRLDSIIDGLCDGLPEAVAAAAREGHPAPPSRTPSTKC